MFNFDLRLSNQRAECFYIWRNFNGYSVGVNGTSIHKFFKRDDFKNSNDLKSAIKTFMYQNFIVKK